MSPEEKAAGMRFFLFIAGIILCANNHEIIGVICILLALFAAWKER